MPKISKDSVEGQDYGGVEVHEGEVGEYTVNIFRSRRRKT